MSTHALQFRHKVQQATTVEDSLTALLHGIAEEIEARHASPKALSELATEIRDNADVLIEDVFDNIETPGEPASVSGSGPTPIEIPQPQTLGAVAAQSPKKSAKEKAAV